MHKVNQIEIKKGMTVNELIKEFSKSGVMGSGRIAKAADILEAMIKDKECKVFFGLAGAMVPGGMRNIIIDILKNKYVDVFVTTGATLTHDLVEALGFSHLKGSEKMDDAELHKKHLVRMYDSLMPEKVYEKTEELFEKNFDLLSKTTNIKDFLWKLGSLTPSPSILNTCYKEKIPIFCPAVSDSGIGLMMWGRLAQGKKCDINAFEDLKEILDIAWTAKKSGVFYVGGGVPKNYIQQAMQFSKQAVYGVQITTDRPEFGGSSGAELREGISWGKMSPKGNLVDVYSDATIALPLIYAAVKERL